MKPILFSFITLLFFTHSLWAQDNIIMRNGDEIKAKVQEVGITEIKYKKADNPNGPLYTVLKSDVFLIKYENGSKEVFGSAESNVPAPQANDNKSAPNTGGDYNQDRRKAIKKIVGGAVMTGLGVPVLVTGVALTVAGIASYDPTSSGNVLTNGPSTGLIVTGALFTAGGIVLEVLGPINLSRGIKARRAARGNGTTMGFAPIQNPGLDRYNYTMNHQTLGAVTFTF